MCILPEGRNSREADPHNSPWVSPTQKPGQPEGKCRSTVPICDAKLLADGLDRCSRRQLGRSWMAAVSTLVAHWSPDGSVQAELCGTECSVDVAASANRQRLVWAVTQCRSFVACKLWDPVILNLAVSCTQ